MGRDVKLARTIQELQLRSDSQRSSSVLGVLADLHVRDVPLGSQFDGFLRAGTIRHAVIVAGDANPGHGMAPGFPYDPVGAALVCGWDPSNRGIADIRWMTVADAPARRHAVMRREHGRNQLLISEDDAAAWN